MLIVEVSKLLKKIDIAKKCYESMTFIQCPICGLDRDSSLELFTCQNGHHFNLAKQGYFNFINRKVNSDYNKEMLCHRRRIVNSYIYAPLINCLNKQIIEKTGVLVDAGCGEGSFTNLLKFTDGFKIGVDLSKDGILLATDYNKLDQVFSVADLTKLPLKDQSVDVIVNILSPAMYKEFTRVLKKDGIIIKVIPNSNYLKELRDLNYRGTNREQYSNLDIKNHFLNRIEMIEEIPISYQVDLDEELALDVLKMSPLTWNVLDEQLDNQVKLLKHLTIDVLVLVGRPL